MLTKEPVDTPEQPDGTDGHDRQGRSGKVIVGSAAECLQESLVWVSLIMKAHSPPEVFKPDSIIFGSKAASSALRLDVELVLRFRDRC